MEPETKAGLLRHVPQVTLLDSLGASEGMASRQAATVDDAEIKPARFAVNDRVKVFREDSGEEVTPGSDEIGLLAVGGRIPVGYWRDPDKTAQTFRVIDGRRYALAGDYAQVDADGTIRLLGRGSACINTGGEKVYPEEVELALRKLDTVGNVMMTTAHPDDRSARSSSRWYRSRKATTSTSPSSKRGVAQARRLQEAGGSCSSTRSSATPPASRTTRSCGRWPRRG